MSEGKKEGDRMALTAQVSLDSGLRLGRRKKKERKKKKREERKKRKEKSKHSNI